ncbi:MAG: mechanosensitive ion channel [Betaproteobacteria bacterium]|nr:mechanosensitive ion channel [Betaproteobacteria bacterium]
MSPLESTIETLAAQAGSGKGLLQLAVVAVSLGLGWLVGGALRRRVNAQEYRWKFGEGGFDRAAFPLAALGLLWGARFFVRKLIPTPFIDLAIWMLVAFAVIRFAVYVLRHVLPKGALLRGSERTVVIAMWLGIVLHATGILPEVRDALDAVSFTLGKQRISLLLVLQGAVSVAVTLAIAMWLAKLVEGRVLANEHLEMSTRVVISKLVQALALFSAILVALPLVGIDITALSVFGGALGVGLGLGLQKIASNYVSGYIILLDRSVRIGDLVTVDNRHGVVKSIESRCTVIRSLDGTESIIPNDTMVTQSVTNHSYTDRNVLVKVPLTVGYDSDVDRVFAILHEIAKAQPRVLADPAPGASITALGDNGIEFVLGVWIADPDQGLASVRSDILKAALEKFRAEGIEIPFPHRDVRVIGTPALPSPQ